MYDNIREEWKIVSIAIDENNTDERAVCEDWWEKACTKSALEYLLQKRHLTKYDVDEELVFFPELYGICPPFKHHNCLKLRENIDLLEEVEEYIKRTTKPERRTPIMRHIYIYNFVEIYLDNLRLKNQIPKEIFQCKNLKVLSLNGNGLSMLPADIGRLKNLETLYLSNNRLKVHSLPFTLTFCRKLHTLFLDNNNMLALPGFLLQMNSLFTLRRQSTKTSFRKMFVIHRSTRISKIRSYEAKASTNEVGSLQKLASQIIISNKIDYFSVQHFPTIVQDVISRNYPNCPLCENCSASKFEDSGYLVSTNRYGYLGNYWSVFLHQACSKKCADQLHESSYKIEQSSLTKLNEEYNKVVSNSQQKNIERSRTQKCCIIS